MCDMKNLITIEEIRRANLRKLIKESPEGTTVALAEKCNTSKSYLSQILTRYKTGSGRSKEIGTDLARKLEKGSGKPVGWMDVLHGGEVDSEENELTNLFLAMDDDMRAVFLQQARLIVGKKS